MSLRKREATNPGQVFEITDEPSEILGVQKEFGETTICNSGTTTVYVKPGEAADAGVSMPFAPGTKFSTTSYSGVWTAVCAEGGTGEIRIWVI